MGLQEDLEIACARHTELHELNDEPSKLFDPGGSRDGGPGLNIRTSNS